MEREWEGTQERTLQVCVSSMWEVREWSRGRGKHVGGERGVEGEEEEVGSKYSSYVSKLGRGGKRNSLSPLVTLP